MLDDRRLMLVVVSQRLLLELFQGPGQCVALKLDHAQLPEDAKVVAVHSDWNRQALVAVVHSDSFDFVPHGQELPIFNHGAYGQISLRYIDGDRVTESRPIREAAAMKWRNAEIEAAKQATAEEQTAESYSAEERHTLVIGRAHTVDGIQLPLPDGSLTKIGTRITQCYGMPITDGPLEGEEIYNGPHLHAALKCLAAGYPENAISWMERDLGEVGPIPEIEPSSLRVVSLGLAYRVKETVLKAGDQVHTVGGPGTALPADALQLLCQVAAVPAELLEGDGRSYASEAEAQADFFRKSIMAG